MLKTHFLKTVLISAVISIVATYLWVGNVRGSDRKQSVYERVINSGILRCGYFPEAPFTIIDPNTGKKSGIAVEIAEKIADELNVKIEWVSAENFGALTEDLRNGRYDAICASTFNMPRAGRIDYTIPYAYVPVFAYTQKGRQDFDGKLDQLDWSKIYLAAIDGEGPTIAAQKRMPDAKFVVLPPASQLAELLTTVVDKKADMAFVIPSIFKQFDHYNPGKLQKVATDKPFYVFNVGFGLKPEEAGLKNVFDFIIRNMMTNGQLEALFKKYDPDGLLFQPEPLYQMTALKSPS
ncbi:MAG: transporter substrate-binding domain-containing protein [Alphaproteobacteria bacterium]